MQQGGQYGDAPPYNARPSSASATSNSNTPAHTHLFNLSHEVAAAAAGGLGLSSNAPSISVHVATNTGHQHHASGATHPYSLGQVLQNQSVHQQARQHYLHFQDHISHHHHQQSLQSPSHASQQQQLVVDHSAAGSSSSPAGLHLHQPAQKQGMVPSISMSLPHHATGVQDTKAQTQQPSLLQHQYSQQQQQHGLGLGLDQSPKASSIPTLHQQVIRGVQQHAAVSSHGATGAAVTLVTVSSSGQTSNAMVQSTAPMSNLATSYTIPAAASISTIVTSNLGTSAGGPTAAAGLIKLPQQMGGAGAGGGSSNSKQAQADQAGAVGGTVAMMGSEEMQDALGDELDVKGGISGGNRWPRQETLALLKLRSEMDSSFRDSSLKRPLWDEVSRKLAELGYHRSAKKCKEKFENVHKYYKRTKEGKAGRQDGKNYRFFSELEALYGNAGNNPPRADLGVRSSTSFLLANSVAASTRAPDLSARTSNPPATLVRPLAADASGLNFLSETSSSDEDNDDEYEDPSDAALDGKKRKRKTLSRMMAFFESLLKQVMEKQEQMQQRFLDALERREQDRMIREEAWKRQEMARMSRENDLRAQERTLAATRDAAIVAFLQKVTGQTIQLPTTTALAIAASPVQVHPPPSSMDPTYHHIPEDQDPFDPNSKRWPKPEVLALIKLRTSLHSRFTEPGPKGPLWEDISIGMSRLGYNRNAKRCKEKWENINKYFKKAKDSNKNRPENAKTCPYYHQLDALYKQGVLGGGSTSIKALPYKSACDNMEINMDNPLLAHHSSDTIGRAGELLAICADSGIDPVQAIVPLASHISTASEATASTGNASAPVPTANAGAVHFYGASNPESSTVGDVVSKELNLQRGDDISPDNVRLVDVNGETQVMGSSNFSPRVEPSLAEETTSIPRTSLQLQHSGVEDVQRSHTHRYSTEQHKVDLEQDGTPPLDEEDEAQHKQQVLLQAHIQQYQQEIRVSSVSLQAAPPGLATQSYIANMLQKFSNDPAESNTSTASTNQQEH